MSDPIYHTSSDQRCKSSEIEKQIIGKLQGLGIPVVEQVKFNTWVFDGAINGTKILVEIHGDYWHERPEVKERDQRKQEWADQNDYLILTIWEADYRKDADAALLTILEHYEAAKDYVNPAEGDTHDKHDTLPAIPDKVYGNWRDRFLAVLSERGIVREACIAAGISRNTAYQAGRDDPEFAGLWKLALQDAADLGLAVYRQRGMLISDRALEFFVKSRDPESYRETSRLEVTGENGGPVKVQLSDAERATRAAAIFDRARTRRAGSAADEGVE
jgi:very-short-patch-repair endonuclease